MQTGPPGFDAALAAMPQSPDQLISALGPCLVMLLPRKSTFRGGSAALATEGGDEGDESRAKMGWHGKT